MCRTGLALLMIVSLGLAIQLIPYGRRHANPEVTREPVWDHPRTREIFSRICSNCHSNQTTWPWYSFVAPVSWLVTRDVEEGRSHFNVSEWDREKNHGDEAAKMVREGEMPPWFYLPAHPEAHLSDEERAEFVDGLIATFGEKRDDEHDQDHEH